MEINVKLTVEAPDLTAALNQLAQAVMQTKATPIVESAPQAPQAPQELVKETKPKTTKAKKQAAQIAAVEPVEATVPETPTQAQAAPTVAPTAPANPAPFVPVASPASMAKKMVTKEDLMSAGATLMEQNKVTELLALLQKHGVQAMSQLKPEQFASFAEGLEQLGYDFNVPF